MDGYERASAAPGGWWTPTLLPRTIWTPTGRSGEPRARTVAVREIFKRGRTRSDRLGFVMDRPGYTSSAALLLLTEVLPLSQ